MPSLKQIITYEQEHQKQNWRLFFSGLSLVGDSKPRDNSKKVVCFIDAVKLNCVLRCQFSKNHSLFLYGWIAKLYSMIVVHLYQYHNQLGSCSHLFDSILWIRTIISIIVVNRLGMNLLVIKLYFLFLTCALFGIFLKIQQNKWEEIVSVTGCFVTKNLIIHFKFDYLLSFLVCVNTTLVHPLSYVLMIHNSQLSALKTHSSELKMTEKAVKVQRLWRTFAQDLFKRWQ